MSSSCILSFFLFWSSVCSENRTHKWCWIFVRVDRKDWNPKRKKLCYDCYTDIASCETLLHGARKPHGSLLTTYRWIALEYLLNPPICTTIDRKHHSQNNGFQKHRMDEQSSTATEPRIINVQGTCASLSLSPLPRNQYLIYIVKLADSTLPHERLETRNSQHSLAYNIESKGQRRHLSSFPRL